MDDVTALQETARTLETSLDSLAFWLAIFIGAIIIGLVLEYAQQPWLRLGLFLRGPIVRGEGAYLLRGASYQSIF